MTESSNITGKSRFKTLFWFFTRLALAVGILGYLVYSQLGEQAPKTHIVKQSATLEELSALDDIYGDASMWEKLLEANKHIVSDPQKSLPVGTNIMVPSNETSIIKLISNMDMRWLAMACLAYFLHLVAGAFRWRMLLKLQKIELSFIESFSLMIQGFFFSLVIPGGALGGDLIKAGRLAARSKKGERLEGALSIFMDRFIGMIALFSLTTILGIISFESLMQLQGMVKLVVLIIFTGSAVGLVSVVLIAFHRQLERIKPIGWILGKADSFSGGVVSRVTNTLDQYRNSWGTVIFSVIFSILFIHCGIAGSAFCIARSAGIETINFLNTLLSICIANTAALVPITPAGVGTRDAVLKELLVFNGCTGNGAITTALIFTAVIILFNLLGGLFFILDPKRKVQRKETEPNTDDETL